MCTCGVNFCVGLGGLCVYVVLILCCLYVDMWCVSVFMVFVVCVCVYRGCVLCV